jgi:signal transduction histidine kinase
LLHNLNAAARLEAITGLAHEDTIDLNRLVDRVVDRHRPVASRKEIALEVIDDGPGIAKPERERAFEPSFRGSGARMRHPRGMGLGLHIARDVAARHRLILTLGETEGGGLTVTLRPRLDT